MKAYTTSEFRQNLAHALNRVKQEGAVKIYNKRGDTFLVTPTKKRSSPFEEVKCLNIPGLSEETIISLVRESREHR